MIRVYALQLNTDIDETSFLLLCSKVSAEKKEKIGKFLRREDALRCLFADLLIRYILVRDNGLKNEDISFGYSNYGKPFCKGHEYLHFNISHSGEWIVCAMDVSPVGIDVELIAPIDIEVAEQYFSKEEYELLAALSGDEQTRFFYHLWTCKESYLKLNGMGLSAPLDAFTISISDEKHVSVSDNTGTLNEILLKQYDIDPAYKMAVCGYDQAFDDITFVKMKDVNSFFLS